MNRHATQSLTRRLALAGAVALTTTLTAGTAHAVQLVGSELGPPTDGDGGETVVDTLVDIDETSGAASSIGSVGFKDVRSLAYDPNSDTLYGIDIITNNLLTIDPSTGAGTVVGTDGLANFVVGLAYDPNSDTLYGADNSADQLVTFDTSTAAGTVIGAFFPSSTDDFEVRGLAYDPISEVLYGVQGLGVNPDELITIDTATGQATVVAGIMDGSTGLNEISGLAFDADTQTLFATNSLGSNTGDQLYTIDTATAAATAVGPLGSSFSNVQGLANIPEPMSFTLFAVAGSMLVGLRRRG